MTSMSMEGTPAPSTYWVATWPLAIRSADHLVGGHKAALAVGDGDGVQVAHLGLQHPGGVDRGHPGGDVPALVAADQVIGQGGAAVVHGPDLPVGHQPQLDEGLEAVADAQHQAVPVLKQVVDRVGQPGVAEEGGDELAGAVGLVAAGEAAGQDHHLAAADGLLQGLSGLGQQVGGQVADHHDLRLDARPQAGLRRCRTRSWCRGRRG